MGESDIYCPYSFYGSETGGDVANDIHDVWGISTVGHIHTQTLNILIVNLKF